MSAGLALPLRIVANALSRVVVLVSRVQAEASPRIPPGNFVHTVVAGHSVHCKLVFPGPALEALKRQRTEIRSLTEG
jgi:hypothetical protein